MIDTVIVTIELDARDVKQINGIFERRLQEALNTGMDKILDLIELVQIHKYLSNSFPPRPSGSRYVRTFQLRRASRKRRVGRHLPDISGEWYVDDSAAPYAGEVIGPASEQAAIHRGRWMSLEQIAVETERVAPAILQEEIDGIQIL